VLFRSPFRGGLVQVGPGDLTETLEVHLRIRLGEERDEFWDLGPPARGDPQRPVPSAISDGMGRWLGRLARRQEPSGGGQDTRKHQTLHVVPHSCQ
jgi:hypothetical protein